MKLVLAIGVALMLGACGDNKEVVKNDSSPEIMVEGAVQEMAGMKVAFYNLDSLKTMYTYYREQDSIITLEGMSFQKELENRQRNLQNYATNSEAQMNKGLLSQDDVMKIQQQMQIRQEAIMKYQQNVGSKIEQKGYEAMEVIGNRLVEYGKEYSELNGIDILMTYTKGGQFNYINSSMDVTTGFTDFLNMKQEEISNL